MNISGNVPAVVANQLMELFKTQFANSLETAM
jgi:hypothetical protein